MIIIQIIMMVVHQVVKYKLHILVRQGIMEHHYVIIQIEYKCQLNL